MCWFLFSLAVVNAALPSRSLNQPASSPHVFLLLPASKLSYFEWCLCMESQTVVDCKRKTRSVFDLWLCALLLWQDSMEISKQSTFMHIFISCTSVFQKRPPPSIFIGMPTMWLTANFFGTHWTHWNLEPFLLCLYAIARLQIHRTVHLFILCMILTGGEMQNVRIGSRTFLVAIHTGYLLAFKTRFVCYLRDETLKAFFFFFKCETFKEVLEHCIMHDTLQKMSNVSASSCLSSAYAVLGAVHVLRFWLLKG